MTPAALKALAEGNAENFAAAMTPGGIEAQEHHGQMTFVTSSTLPKEMLHGTTREKLQGLGIVFGQDADDLFVKVSLPAGWRVRPTLHSMWSDLLDERGRRRAAIFYKAAFYDRSAHISLTRRYGVQTYLAADADGKPVDEHATPSHFRTVVMDGDQELHQVGVRKNGEPSDRYYAAATAWLAEHFPRWEDELAYWD